MEDREVGSDRSGGGAGGCQQQQGGVGVGSPGGGGGGGVAGGASSYPGHQYQHQWSAPDRSLTAGRKKGPDSISQSSEESLAMHSAPDISSFSNTSQQSLLVDQAIDAVTIADSSPSQANSVAHGNGVSTSLSVERAAQEEDEEEEEKEEEKSEEEEDSFVLTPMASLSDSAIWEESNSENNMVSESSSRLSGDLDFEMSRSDRSDRDYRSPTSPEPAVIGTNGSTCSSNLDLGPRDGLHLEVSRDREGSRSSGGQLSDGWGRSGTEASVASNSSTSLNKPSKHERNSDKKKKGSYWYNYPAGWRRSSRGKVVLSPTYKSRSEDFKRIFKDIPNNERLIVDYSCALQKDILVHGRLYITQNWICFYANIFRWETVLTIRCREITAMTKEKTARVIPNAIQISTDTEKQFFTSFGARDKTFLMLFRVWQNALLDQPMTQRELWQWVHYSYGEELGLTSSDDDYVAPTQDDAEKFQTFLSQEEMSHTDPQDKDPADDEEIILNTGVNGHVLPIPSPINPKLSSPSTISTVSDNNSVRTNSTEDIQHATDKMVTQRLDVPSPGAASNDLPTDLGDTTEEEDVEVVCTDHDHTGFTTLDEIFSLTCDQIFELLFTDTDFYSEFVKARKTYDLVLSPWPVEPDFEARKVRMITYTLSLNYSIGPKCSPSTEKQTLYGQSKPGYIYVIDCEVVNGGIPYGDNFYVVNRYCITRVSAHQSRLRVTSEIKYKRTVWGIVKSMIEKNAHTGLNENFSLLAQHLRAEGDKMQATAAGGQKGQQQPQRKKKRRRRIHSTTDWSPSAKRPAEGKSQQAGSGPAGHKLKDEWQFNFNAETVVRGVCTVLLLLLIFNAVLFYKLWSLEGHAVSPHYSRHSVLHTIGDKPRTKEEWLTLLDQQRQLHDLEMDRWRDILSSSVQLMEQMKNILQDLQLSIEKRSRIIPDKGPPPTV